MGWDSSRQVTEIAAPLPCVKGLFLSLAPPLPLGGPTSSGLFVVNPVYSFVCKCNLCNRPMGRADCATTTRCDCTKIKKHGEEAAHCIYWTGGANELESTSRGIRREKRTTPCC